MGIWDIYGDMSDPPAAADVIPSQFLFEHQGFHTVIPVCQICTYIYIM